MGGGSSKNTTQRINSLQISSSAYAIAIACGWGQGTVGLNLLWAPGSSFKSVEHDKQEGGKGGGSTSQSFTYSADLLFGICDTASGKIRGLNSIFVDKSVFTGSDCVSQAGFSFLGLGESGQDPWDYLTSSYPDQADGYDTIALLGGSAYPLNDQAGLPNITVEVNFAMQVGNGIVDANPGGNDGIVADFLAFQVPQWPTGGIGDLSNYGNYCLAAGLLLSPVLDTQQQASSFLDEILMETNAQCWIRGDGTLQIRPLADAAVTGNGVTYTPDLTPVYDLTSNDFIVDDPADDPITIDTANLDDLYNYVQVQFKNRQHQYNDETVPAFDQASIDEIGQRKQDPTDCPSVKDPVVARLVAQLLVQQTSSLARPFTFNLPWCFDLLEEMDVVSVTNKAQKLDRTLCRIQQIDEDGDTGKLTIQVTEILIGTANAPFYPSQTAGGIVTDFEADPGSVNPPVLLIPPTSITNSELQVWAGVAGTNTNYGGCFVYASLNEDGFELVGTIAKGARFGVSVNALPSATDPDNTNTLTVDLSASGGALSNGTVTDFNAATTLCWVGGELIAFETAALSGTPDNPLYILSPLRRGLYNSIIKAHPAGTQFVRLDSAIFKDSFLSQQTGETLHLKFAAFNIFGRNVQDLSECVDYTVVLQPPSKTPGTSTLTLQSAWAGASFTVVASAAANALGYTFRVYTDATKATLVHQSNETPATSFTYTDDMAVADGHVLRSYAVTVTPANQSGDAAESTPLVVTNPAPAAVTGVSKTGSGGSVTINWTANSETDLVGYVAYYSQTTGFDPTQAGSFFYQGAPNNAGLSGLTTGQIYYVRVAAYDTWSSDIRTLNFSAQFQFTA